MKSAFSMIELIFVIVALGILSSVLIPRFIATRDDAITVKIATSIMSGAGEIASYAVAQGVTDTNLALMSENINSLVNTENAILSSGTVEIPFGNINDCVTIAVLSNATDENLSITLGNSSGDSLCSSLHNIIDTKQYPMQLRGSLVSH